MSLQQQIKDQIKEAMLNKQTIRLNVLRGLSSGFTNELVAKGRKPQEELNDEDALAVIKKQVKQRKDSIEQFTRGGREDLAITEREELAVLEKYLPQTMGKDEIRIIAEAKKKEMNITDKAQMGQFMGTLMKEFKGKANGSDVKEVVESLFS